MKRVAFLCGLLISGYLLAAQQSDYSVSADSRHWKLKRDKHDVQVYLGNVTGSKYKAVRAVTRIQVRLQSVVALLRDTGACPEWADLCQEAHVHEQLTDTDLLVYTRNHLPWPVSDRDLVAEVVWSQDRRTGIVTMDSHAVDGVVARHKGCVRLTQAHTVWVITPLGQGWVEVAMEAHVNPEGPLPAWVTNHLLVKSPYKTVLGLRKAVFSPKYANARFGFIDG